MSDHSGDNSGDNKGHGGGGGVGTGGAGGKIGHPSQPRPQSEQAGGVSSAPHASQADFNRGGMIAFAGSMIFTLVYFVYVAFFSGGVDLKEISPEALEASQQLAEGGAAAPEKAVDVSNVKEPWLETPDLVAHGKALYKTNCALCHGPGGKGDGPAGASLNPKPRNLVAGGWKKGGTTLGMFDVLSHGLPPSAMASYAHLPAVDRWSLAHYVRSITNDKVPDNMDELKKMAPTLK